MLLLLPSPERGRSPLNILIRIRNILRMAPRDGDQQENKINWLTESGTSQHPTTTKEAHPLSARQRGQPNHTDQLDSQHEEGFIMLEPPRMVAQV